MSTIAERGSWHFLYTYHVCQTFTASSWCLIFFSLQLPSHISTKHLLSSELSIPNRLTGLWQEMLVDLLDALCSSRACLTCIFLETISCFPSHLSLSLFDVSYIFPTLSANQVMNSMFLYCEYDGFVQFQLKL